jgi:methylated-DNA-[protein]-cysteine S-methyltransferase
MSKKIMHQNFSQKVYAIVAKIPKGKVLTYKEVARRAGSPKAYRAVGNILSKNIDKNIPCHRVIRSDGKVGGYSGLVKGMKKADILKKEGVILKV